MTPRNGLVKHIGKDTFLVHDKAGALPEVSKHETRIDKTAK
jgi:hypothetical protein